MLTTRFFYIKISAQLDFLSRTSIAAVEFPECVLLVRLKEFLT
jgi:hypothetical protein